MSEFRVLKKSDVKGMFANPIFKKYGLDANASDLTRVMGGIVYSDREYQRGYPFPRETKNNGIWFYDEPFVVTGGSLPFTYLSGVGPDKEKIYEVPLMSCHGSGARVVLDSYEVFSKGVFVKELVSGVQEFEYGEYPQTVAEYFESKKIEELYQNNSLNITEKKYTLNGSLEHCPGFVPQEYQEYEYNGKKYIRVIADIRANSNILSNDIYVRKGDVVWFEVEPIKWLVHNRSKIAIAKDILFAKINYSNDNEYVEFEKSFLKEYYDNYFSKDIIPSKNILKGQLVFPQVSNKKESKQASILDSDNVDANTDKSIELNEFEDGVISSEEQVKYENCNPYRFNLDNVTEEEIIRGALESDMPVFLHGRSSDGKSARVKQYDPDCEIIYLRNATPDSLNGKSVYNSETGEMIDIPPTWYKNLCEKCENEPDKIHIVFFDEITNSLPSIQGMAFNIVLDKEVNGIWKLPENARIVAAGNEVKDSLAANEMAEPLFNRFAHVYIETTIDDWLEWAASPDEECEELEYEENVLPMKIHPAIYSYIAYKNVSNDDVLRTPYNGVTPNADPRKWEMASKVLYKTNQPHMLRALIGEDLTTDFIEFCAEQVLTVDDVLIGNYTEGIFNIDLSKKYATAVGLTYVDEENLEEVRNFVKKLGPEVCATFDVVWSRGNEKRLEKIAELKMIEEEMSK